MEKHDDKWPEHHQDVMTSILGVLPHLKLQEVRRDQPSQIEAFLKLDILSTRASFALFVPVGYSRLLGSVAEPTNLYQKVAAKRRGLLPGMLPTCTSATLG